MNKTQRHVAIANRARKAIADMYHNATPRYPSLDDAEAQAFQGWFDGEVSDAIEHINDGGAYGPDYLKTLWSDGNAGRYKSAAARAYYVNWKMRTMREDCANRDVMWERIARLYGEVNLLYGEVDLWGRGGRTLAPRHLVDQRGGSAFHLDVDYVDNLSLEATVDLIRVIESLTAYVVEWCEAVPDMWAEWRKDNQPDDETRFINENSHEERERDGHSCEASDILKELLEWEAHMGGWEAPVWKRAHEWSASQ